MQTKILPVGRSGMIYPQSFFVMIYPQSFIIIFFFYNHVLNYGHLYNLTDVIFVNYYLLQVVLVLVVLNQETE